MDRAASSISDGDLVDALIHGSVSLCLILLLKSNAWPSSPEQHWSLMPLHAVCSTIRPAAALYGMGAHYGGPNSMTFPQCAWYHQSPNLHTDLRAKMAGTKFKTVQAQSAADRCADTDEVESVWRQV